jgi:hypothetical protein
VTVDPVCASLVYWDCVCKAVPGENAALSDSERTVHEVCVILVDPVGMQGWVSWSYLG